MKKRLLILIASIIFIMVTGGPLLAGEIKHIMLDVTGMTCKMCPKAVKKSISRVDGVEAVDVSLKDKKARVKYDADKTDVKEIIKAVEKVGYGAKGVEGGGIESYED